MRGLVKRLSGLILGAVFVCAMAMPAAARPPRFHVYFGAGPRVYRYYAVPRYRYYPYYPYSYYSYYEPYSYYAPYSYYPSYSYGYPSYSLGFSWGGGRHRGWGHSHYYRRGGWGHRR